MSSPGSSIEPLRANLDRVGVLSRLEASVIVLGAIELAIDLHHDASGRGPVALSPRSLLIARAPRRKQAGDLSGLSLGFDDEPNDENAAYLAPEARESGKKIDERADVWSLALVAFEALTGARPHEPPWSPDRARLIALRPDTGRALSALLHRALSADPADRPASLAQFREALLEALAAPTAVAGDPSRVQIVAACGAAIVALVMAFTTGTHTEVQEPPKPSPSPARVPLTAASANGADATNATTSGASVPREAPSGR